MLTNEDEGLRRRSAPELLEEILNEAPSAFTPEFKSALFDAATGGKANRAQSLIELYESSGE